MDVLSYDAVLSKVVADLPRTHPHTAKYPAIAGPLAREIAYLEWRRHRMFDHFDIMPGATMPDGEMGYAVVFYEGKDVTGPAVPTQRTVRISREELRELHDKIGKELNL